MLHHAAWYRSLCLVAGGSFSQGLGGGTASAADCGPSAPRTSTLIIEGGSCPSLSQTARTSGAGSAGAPGVGGGRRSRRTSTLKRSWSRKVTRKSGARLATPYDSYSSAKRRSASRRRATASSNVKSRRPSSSRAPRAFLRILSRYVSAKARKRGDAATHG